MTIREQLHTSATHKPGNDPACPVCAEPEHVETWYEIQYSVKGADDWFSLGGKSSYDSLNAARVDIERRRQERPAEQGYELRIVRKTLTEDVVR